MNSRTVKLEESGLEMRSGRRMIFKILDTQINNYKLQFITDWEGNHDLSPDEKDEKIAKLETIKEELNSMFRDMEYGSKEVSFSLNLEVSLKDVDRQSSALSQLSA